MNAWDTLLEQGGPLMFPLLLVSLLLYERCFDLVLVLRRTRQRLRAAAAGATISLEEARLAQAEVQDYFSRQRIIIGALIAAAPLLGLLGTVMGMIATFDSLAQRVLQKTAEGLAGGISMALVTTQAGLSIAIPALIVLSVAHRQLQKLLHSLVELENDTASTS